MKHLMLRGLVVGPVSTNCYFLKNKDTDEILIVDPGAEPDYKSCGAAFWSSGGNLADPWTL